MSATRDGIFGPGRRPARVAADPGSRGSRSSDHLPLIALDSRGMVTSDRKDLASYKKPFARDPELVAGWTHGGGAVGLADAVRNFRPTVLIGTSTQTGAFTEEIVRVMGAATERPAFFALSNPTSMTEIHPEDALRWTDGRALVATGSPFPPVTMDGEVREIRQGNNVLCFPGIGLGVLASGARGVTSDMLVASARAVAGEVTEENRAAGQLYPPIRTLRDLSRKVALAVARASGLAKEDILERIDSEIWFPEYVPYRAIDKVEMRV